MKIFVKQDKITLFGRRYVVYQNKKKLYTIRRLWLTPIPKYAITEYHSGKRIGRMQNKFLSFRGNAVISIPSGQFKFDQEAIYSMKYSCKRIGGMTEEYKLKGNKGFTGSIYKDKEQIGQWDKNRFVIFDGDAYEIDLDFDSDKLLMATMMVLIDTYRISVTVGGDIGWEVGNIGKDLKRRKSNWTPKEKTKS